MAMFREHIAFGAVVAAIGATLVFFYAYMTDFRLLALLFGITTVMSFWPDLDSDSGMPFHLIFGTFTVAVSGVALYFMLTNYPDDWRYLIGVPLGVLAFVWIAVGYVFKKLTHHRGMFHSLPAAAVAGLATLLLAKHLEHPDIVATIFALGAVAGYMSHLVLDVIYDSVTLDGKSFLPSPKLGGAMKLFSSSGWANLFTYVLLIALASSAF
jgi:membrane-bound metal-dependent hydrolase YbcI (DUF457 family)